MSHSAYVAFESGQNQFDVHYSHNGAQDLQLTPLLREHADDIEQAKREGFGTISEVPQVSKWGSSEGSDGVEIETRASDEAIEPEPLATDVPLEALGIQVDFANMEAFYVVRSGRVETYVPVWTYPDVVRAWRDTASVEVYRSGKMPPNPTDIFEELKQIEPLHVIDDEALTGEFLDTTVVRRVVRDEHHNVFALLHKGVEELGLDGSEPRYSISDLGDNDVIDPDDVGVMLLQTHSYNLAITLVGDADALPTRAGRGVFVDAEIAGNSRREIELKGGEIRFRAGTRLNTMKREPTDEDIREAEVDVLKELYTEYDDAIAEFSPPPYGQIIEAFNRVDELTDGVQSKLQQLLKPS